MTELDLDLKNQFNELAEALADFLYCDWQNIVTKILIERFAPLNESIKKDIDYMDRYISIKRNYCDDLADLLKEQFHEAGYSEKEWEEALIMYVVRPADTVCLEKDIPSGVDRSKVWPNKFLH